MMDNRVLKIGSAIVRKGAEREINEGMSAEDKLLVCFRVAMDRNHVWYLNDGDDDGYFKLGVAAFLGIIGPDDPAYERTLNSLDAINAFSAAISGVPVDMARALGVVDGEPFGDDHWFPLMPLYREAKESKEKT